MVILKWVTAYCSLINRPGLMVFLMFLLVSQQTNARFSFHQQVNITAFDLYGKWEVFKVVEDGRDITQPPDIQASRWIVFYPDGMFESDGYPFGRYSGTYHLEVYEGMLILKSDTYDRKAIQWKVSYDGDHLIFAGTGKFTSYRFYMRKYE